MNMKFTRRFLSLISGAACLMASSMPSNAEFVKTRDFEEIRNAASGDVVFSDQSFNRWNLLCNELLSKRLKECSLANKDVSGETYATETIVTHGVDDKLYFMIAIITPDKIDRENGFFIDVNGKQRFITEDLVACINLDRMCTIQLPFDADLREAFEKELPIAGRFYISNDAGGSIQRRLKLDMNNTSLGLKYFDQMILIQNQK